MKTLLIRFLVWALSKLTTVPEDPAPEHPEREIFEYWDGSKKTAIDPMVAMQRIDEHPTYNPDQDPELIEKKGDLCALARAVDATRKAFELEEFEDLGNGKRKGLTQAEILELHVAFCYYMDDLQKKTSASRTSSPPTEESTSSRSEWTTTKPMSDSTKTSPEPTSVKPIVSG